MTDPSPLTKRSRFPRVAIEDDGEFVSILYQRIEDDGQIWSYQYKQPATDENRKGANDAARMLRDREGNVLQLESMLVEDIGQVIRNMFWLANGVRLVPKEGKY